MKKYANRGFTLIELLVVIAIIGILSSVVLASLSTARTKGKIAAFKEEANSLRSQGNIACDGGTSSTAISYTGTTLTYTPANCTGNGTFSVTVTPTDTTLAPTTKCGGTVVTDTVVTIPASCI